MKWLESVATGVQKCFFDLKLTTDGNDLIVEAEWLLVPLYYGDGNAKKF